MLTLRDLLLGITSDQIAPLPIKGIECHSKKVRPGDLFVAISGELVDGHSFIGEAISRGAAAVVAERISRQNQIDKTLPGDPWGKESHSNRLPCPCVVVPNTRQALSTIASRFYSNPSQKLKLIGVTGTNGKTTTTSLMKSILDVANEPAGMLGTIAYRIGDRELPSTNTTPGPLELHRYLSQMVHDQLKWCVMEVSSHALSQGRIDGVEFDAAVFTTLGSDHLDYHKTQEAYAASKRRLFEHLRPGGYAVINADDEFGRQLAGTIPNRTIMTYGINFPAQVNVHDINCSWQGIEMILETPWGVIPIKTPIIGRHNICNLTAAATALLSLGIPPSSIQHGLSNLKHVPGRLERIPADDGLNVFIDYAHTSDALRLAIASLRELTNGRLIVVFGCGGDRDRGKRSPMGNIASQLADHVILTSDNPRKEDPDRIINDIQTGFHSGFDQFQIIPGREEAITAAIELANPEDSVLIAGKGHESSQVFEHVTVPFSDREVASRVLQLRNQMALTR